MVWLFNANNGKTVNYMAGHESSINISTFSIDGRF